jgi:2-polyprenyl-3-methyl-5-hydroxy-6-metoxy-1,4-benzoquinol methylase
MRTADTASAEFRYDLPLGELSLPAVCHSFSLSFDAATRDFVEHAEARPHGALRTTLHHVLRRYFSDFDVNAWLGMYPMFLLGGNAFRALLAASGGDAQGRLLDVGAGSGDITAAVADGFREVCVTETSRGMARKLARRGFCPLHVDLSESPAPGAPFDVITLFNVLDRTPLPRTLLTHLRESLAPSGRLVVATPLPFAPFYYDGPRTREPHETLGLAGETWSADAERLVRHALPECGLEPLLLARAPYLSGGDARRLLYVLDDAILVCRRA